LAIKGLIQLAEDYKKLVACLLACFFCEFNWRDNNQFSLWEIIIIPFSKAAHECRIRPGNAAGEATKIFVETLSARPSTDAFN